MIDNAIFFRFHYSCRENKQRGTASEGCVGPEVGTMSADLCSSCCAVLSILGIVHLLLFGGMFRLRAVSLHIKSVENDWDVDEKARACFNGAIFYAVTLFISVVVGIYTRRSRAMRMAQLEVVHAEMSLH